MHFWVKTVCVCAKRSRKKNKEKNWNFGLLYLRNGWSDLLQIWDVALHHRRALPQQIWCSSDKRSRIYECVKIATLLFLLIYSLPFVHAPGFLGCTTHYRVSWQCKKYYNTWTKISHNIQQTLSNTVQLALNHSL